MQYGVSDSNELESEVKKNMVKQSSRLYLIINHTKFESTGLTEFAKIDRIDAIITDDGIDPREAKTVGETEITPL